MIVEEVISSSVINATGSNTLGDASNDTQTLRGTVVIPDTATGASETTALFINASNQINKRALQSNAFTSTSIPTAASDIGALAVDNNLSDLETVSTARTNLGLGSFATLNSLAFASLTSKPTTIAGYGITDALQIGTTATTALAGNTLSLIHISEPTRPY